MPVRSSHTAPESENKTVKGIETSLLSFQNFSLISFSLFVKITNSFYGLSMTIDVHACLTTCLLTAASAAHCGCNSYWILVCTDGLDIHRCSRRCGCQSYWFSSDVVVVVASLNVPSDLLLWSIVLYFTSDCFSSLQSARLLNMFIFLSSPHLALLFFSLHNCYLLYFPPSSSFYPLWLNKLNVYLKRQKV